MRARSNGIGIRSCSTKAWRAISFGRVDVAPGGQPHAAAAGADGQHPGAVDPAAVVFQRLDQRLGFGMAAE